MAYFGDMAASGGYWVSTAAQRVVSNPLSITGSIGVYGMMPTFDKSLAKLDDRYQLFASCAFHSQREGRG